MEIPRKRKKKKRKVSQRRQSRNPIITLLGLILIVLTAYNLYVHIYKNRTLTLTVASNYSSIIESNALVIRDEIVYNTSGSVKNSDIKVAVGTPLEATENYSNNTGYNLNALESEIKTLENILANYDEFEIKRKKITSEMMGNLYRELENGNLVNVNNWYSESFQNFNLTEDQLYDRLTRLKIHHDIITKQGKDIVTLNTGEIINGIDHYETVLSYDIVKDMGNDYFFSEESLKEFSEGKEGYKIVNNLSYVLRITMNTNDIYKAYEIGSPITIGIGDNTFKGTVESLNIDKDHTEITALFQEGFNSIKNIRSLPLTVINYETNAFEIPKTAILKKEDQDGVYIRSASGIVNFKAVQILSEKGSKSIVDAGTDGYITVKDKEIKTVESYDELLLNPKAVKEGELLN